MYYVTPVASSTSCSTTYALFILNLFITLFVWASKYYVNSPSYVYDLQAISVSFTILAAVALTHEAYSYDPLGTNYYSYIMQLHSARRKQT